MLLMDKQFKVGDKIIIHPDPKYLGYDPKNEGIKDTITHERKGNFLIKTKKFPNGTGWFEHELEKREETK